MKVKKPSTSTAVSTRPSAAVWVAPEGNEAKINVDGGVSRQGNVGAAAAICRDKEGRFLGASAVVFDGLVDAAGLEAHACNEALALAKDLNLTHLMIASDCLEVVSNIDKGAATHYAPVLHEIKDQRKEFQHVNFKFEHRENNFEAHALAKAAPSLLVGRHIWLGTLPDIICIPMFITL